MDFKNKYFNAWQTAWGYHKKFASMQGTEADWDAVVKEFEETSAKYRGRSEHEFVKNLMLAVLSELERDYKARNRREMD